MQAETNNFAIGEKQVAVKFENVGKAFGEVKANSGVSFDVYKGEVLSLLGENGSGKTTLMNMLSGIYYPDEGNIYIDGELASIKTPKDAHALGIGMVHQHFKLVDIFTGIQNVALGLDKKITFNLKKIRSDVEEICARYGFEINFDKKIYDMSVSEKQTLEIVKVLYRGANILVLDEPTAVLTPQETEKLFAVIRNMREDGKSIIIITHKLNEVMEISDRVAILRKGEYIGTIETKDANEKILTEMMVGKKVELKIDRPEIKFDRPLLEIRDLSVKADDGNLAIKFLYKRRRNSGRCRYNRLRTEGIVRGNCRSSSDIRRFYHAQRRKYSRSAPARNNRKGRVYELYSRRPTGHGLGSFHEHHRQHDA